MATISNSHVFHFSYPNTPDIVLDPTLNCELACSLDSSIFISAKNWTSVGSTWWAYLYKGLPSGPIRNFS